MKAKIIIGIVCIVFFSIGFVKQESEIKIGLAISTSARNIQDAQYARWGAVLAVEEINNEGGVNRKTLALIIEDDKDTKEGAISVAEKLAEQKDILAVVGHIYSMTTLASAPIYNKSEIVQLSPIATSPAVTFAGDWTFRICTNDRFQARDIARYSVKDLNKSRIAIFYEDGVYGKGLRDEFSKTIRIYGKTVVYEKKYTLAEKNFADAVNQMNNTQPDLVFIAGYAGQGLEIIKEIRKSGKQYGIVGSDGFDAYDLIKHGGKIVEGVMIIRLFNHKEKNSRTQTFVQNFKKKYNAVPNDNAAFTYDAVKLTAEALKQGASRSAVREYLSQIGKKYPVYEGVTGKVIFDKNGDRLKPVVIMVIKNGELEIL